MPNEIIGGISVAIEVDLPGLQAQFDQAQKMAKAAGDAMASAFTGAGAGITGLGEAAQSATSKVASLSSALGTAASGFTNAGITLSAVSAGIIGLGVAALETAGKFEQWQVSFTRLLGSAQDAKQMLSELVDFAISTPFEIKDLVPNAQKLMAMGFAARDVIPMLHTLGDAVSGLGKGATSLNSLTLAFGEMEAKGVIQLRQLNMLATQGIPAIQMLADAYGKSTLQITDMISKKLIPASEGIPILLAGINSKFAGMMEAQSQTLLGMWSNLEDATTKTLNSIGQTMLPLFKSLEQGAFSLLSTVQKLAEAFGSLPVPVQEIAFGLAALVAAIGPLLLGLGAVSFAIKSMVELPAAFNALATAVGLMGGSAKTAAVEVTALAEAETLSAEAAGTAAIATKEATFGFAAMDTAVKGAAIAAAALIGYDIGSWAYNNIPGVKAFGDSITEIALKTPFFGAAMQDVIDKIAGVPAATKAASEGAFLLSQKLGELGIVIPQGTMSLEQWTAALIKAAEAHTHESTAAAEANKGLLKLQETYSTLQDNLEKAQSVLAAAAEGMKNGTVSAGEYQLALHDVDEAQKKLNAGSKDYQDTLSGMTEAYNKQQNTVSTLENTIAQLLGVQDRTQAQDIILAEATSKLTALLKQQADAHGLVAAAAQGQGRAYDGLAKSANDLMTRAIATSLALSQSKAVLDQLTASDDRSAEHTRAVIAGLEQYGNALRASGADLTKAMSITVDGTIITGKLADIIQKAKEHLSDFNTEMVTVPQVVETATGRLNGMVIPLGFIATGVDAVVNVINNKAIPALKTFTDLHPQLASGADFAASALKRMNDETERSVTAAGHAVNANSSLAASITKVAEATADALSVENAWNGATATAVDHNSQFANSISGVTGALHNMVTAADAAGTAAFDADKSFKATTGSVNALSVGVALLAMQMSGLTAFAGSGGIINQNQNPGDLQHQLWLAKNAAGDPSAPNGLITILPKVTAALGDLKNSVSALGDSAAKATASTIQYVDGLGNVYNSYQEMAAAIAKNPALGGLFSTITKGMNDFASIPVQAVAGNLNGVSDAITSLGDAAGSAAQAIAYATSSIGSRTTNSDGSTTTTGDFTDPFLNFARGGGDAGKGYTAPFLTTGVSAGSNPTVDFLKQLQSTAQVASDLAVVTGPMADNNPTLKWLQGLNQAASVAASMKQNLGPGSSASNYYAGYQAGVVPTNNVGTVTSTAGESRAGITLQIINPVVRSQTEAEQVLSQAINYLRNTAGLKL